MRFVTDAALGKLGRHLRAAGFDTLCQLQRRQDGLFSSVDNDRVIVTRTTAVRRRFKDRRLVFVTENDPWRQLAQVVSELGLRWADTKFFSRCLQCNREIRQIDRAAVRHRVPAFVWQCHQTFHVCEGCRRVYWAGSHHDRMNQRLAAVFRNQESEKR